MEMTYLLFLPSYVLPRGGEHPSPRGPEDELVGDPARSDPTREEPDGAETSTSETEED